MSFLKILFWRCKKHWLFQLLLLVQLWFLIIGMLIMTGSIQQYTLGMRLLNRIQGLKDAWYWSIDDSAYIQEQTDLQRMDEQHRHEESEDEHRDGIRDHYAYFEQIVSIAMDTGAFVGVGDLNFNHFTTPMGGFDLVLYNDAMRDHIKLPVIKGKWLTEKTESGAPAIVVDKTMARQYPVGSLVHGVFEYWDNSTAELTMEVVGIIDLEGHSFDFFTGGDTMRAHEFFTPVLGYAVIAKSEFPLDHETNPTSNMMLFPKKDISPKELEEALTYIKPYGWLVSMEDINNNSITEIKFHLGFDLPPNSMLFIIGLLGLLGHMALAAIESQRENAVYYICGAKRKWILGVEWLRCGLLFIIPSIGAWFYTNNSFLWHSYKTHSTFWIGWGISMGMAFLAMLVASRSKTADRPIDTLRRWE